ncbi:hypothetical protein KHQ88_05080 [Mycoplasmatota bacterium]|nr:hypothetical protein KHQ88_05080 [Mycoplasmatota bacterium]
MITLFIVLILSLIVYLKSKSIKKYNTYLYIIFILLSSVSLFFPKFVIFMPWIKGFLGLAIFYLVMMAGALPDWKFKKKLYSVRTELSILGFIVITPHAIFNLLRIFKGEIDLTIFGIIAYLIMIPLFITSFITIRIKMNRLHWKNLQRLAYIVYILLFIHLIIHYTLAINRILYIILLIFYLAFKTVKTLKYIKAK